MDKKQKVAFRRKRLAAWIEKNYRSQSHFVSTHEVSQSEISGLLNNKSFAEGKVETLEKKTDIPKGYLDGLLTINAAPDLNVRESGKAPYQATENADTITIPQYKDVRGAMGEGAYLLDKTGEIVDWKVTELWANNLPPNTGLNNLKIVTGLGNSMKGMFNSGDPLIVDTGIKTVEFDAVYFFRVGNEGFIKILQRIPGQGILAISKNPENRDWVITETMDFEVFGRVLKAWQGVDL